MYQSREAYTAESIGHSAGMKQGQAQGYEAGHIDGWNEAIADAKPKFQQLENKLREAREDLSIARQVNNDQSFALNAAQSLVIAALQTLENAPQEFRDNFCNALLECSNKHIKSGHLRKISLIELSEQNCSQNIVSTIKRWCENAATRSNDREY
jgi:flagellar biosynthesis/type III secretory pathway protein FliH